MAGNDDQREFWSNQAGPKWVALQQAMDAKMQPVLDGIFARAGLTSGQTVLDVGSGTGASTLMAADRVGPNGMVIGADISPSMSDLAEKRAAGRPNARFLVADVADYAFDPASVDSTISRFGVMFFADPVAAMRNIAKSMKPGTQMTFACWGQIPNNPFFTMPAGLAKEIVGAVPRPDPDAPGPFAFRDPQRVKDILSAAGWSDFFCDTTNVHLTPEGAAAEVADVLSQIGPAEAALTYHNAGPDTRTALISALTNALSAFQTPQGIRIPAEINYVMARA